MSLRATATLAICLAGGLAAGIALARPASNPAPAAPQEQATAAAPAPAATAGGYGGTIAPAQGAAVQQPAAQPVGGTLTIADFAFAPLTVQAGATVTVANVDSAPHTATATDGAFDSGDVGAGASGSFTAPAAPGTYSLFCAIHPSMQGQLVVT